MWPFILMTNAIDLWQLINKLTLNIFVPGNKHDLIKIKREFQFLV